MTTKAPVKKPTSKQVPLLVTTTHKGVFFGFGVVPKAGTKEIRIEQAQNCISWDSSIRGVFGLAGKGPNSNCKIGPAVPAITLHDVTAITEATDEAAAAWKKYA